MHKAQIPEWSCRRIADSHADRSVVAAEAGSAGHTVVKVKSAVIALYNVRSVHELPVCGICRILIGTVNGALATPVGQVRHRSRVGGVVQHAEGFAALFVVGAVQVYTVTEHMGFAVRNTFINGEKRVICLFFHQKKLLSFHFRRNNIVPPGLSSLYAIFLHLSIAFFIKKQKKRFINLVVLTKLFRWCFYVENCEFCRKDTCQASFQHTLIQANVNNIL